MDLKQRDTQTQIKHKILEDYLEAWGGIILNGLRKTAEQMRKNGQQLNHHFVYVDCFSYIGRYLGNATDIFKNTNTDLVYGSPIIGIEVLDKLTDTAKKSNINLKVTSILIERDSESFANLLETLKLRNLQDRVKQTNDFFSLQSGEIAVVKDDSTTLVSSLIKYTKQDYTKAFYLIDPYGAAGIPYSFVKSIIQGAYHDVMINFVYQDLHKKSGSLETPEHQRHIEHWSAAFGDKKWVNTLNKISQNQDTPKKLLYELGIKDNDIKSNPFLEEIAKGKSLTDSQQTKLTEYLLVDLYQKTLFNMDNSLAIKSIRLLFPDRNRTMFYLFLTTHDPTGALTLNEILVKAEFHERELRYKRNIAKNQPQQIGLFETTNLSPTPKRPTKEQCAEMLMENFSGKRLTRRDLYRELAEDIYFASEIDIAIRHLKSKAGGQKVSYDGELRHDTQLSFK